MNTQVPNRPQGWEFCGADGAFHVWRAGSNDYRITKDGVEVARREHFGLAHSEARRLRAVDDYYADRAASGQAALTAHP